MNKRTLAFLAVTATLSAGGIGLAACSSDNTNGGLPSVGNDSSTQDQTTGSDGNSQADTNQPGNDSGPVGEAGTDCGKPPKLHAEDGGEGPYCPFQDAGTGDANDNFTNCPAGDHCCNPGKTSPAYCKVGACGFPEDSGAADFECDTPLQCKGANAKCCMTGSVLTDNKCGAPYFYGSRVSATTCRAGTCQAGEVEICGTQGECAAGTCTAFSTKGKDLGYCKQ